jgi:hypothetical protein
MRTLSLAVAAGVAGCSVAPRPGPVHGEVVLSIGGRVENGPFRFGHEDLLALPRRSLRGRPPAAPPATFEGLSLAVLLTERMQVAEGADTAVVRSRDGYAVGVPLVLVRQFKPVLADRADGRPLPDWERSAGREARPLLLAWPNLEWPGFDSDPRVRGWWPSDVDSIEVVRWEQTYGKALRVPAGAGDDARLGAEAYSFHCIMCHRMRGFGGQKGPELTRVATGKDWASLVKRFRVHAFATGLPASPPRGDEALRRIGSFLRAVTLAGPAPDEEQPKGDEELDSGTPDDDWPR